jgi:acyl-CoA thioester hydrolase
MDDYRFTLPIEVRYGDLDPQGHVNNAKHLTYFEQARVQYLIELGLFSTDQSFMEIGVILADAQITYLATIRYGQKIRVGARAVKLGNKSITMAQNIVDATTGEALATGGVVMVAYDYQARKTIPLPEEWRKKIQAYEGIKE